MRYELTTTSEYIRSKEVFLIQISMSDYLLEYYAHRGVFAPNTSPEHDAKLKDAMAAFSIHLTARTLLETHAWTLHMVADEPYSLFVTGSTGELDEHGVARGFLVGHVLTEHIRHSDINAFHAQFSYRGKTFRSFVQSESSAIDKMVEHYYEQSEQRPIRIFLSPDSDTAIGLAALPGFDPEWFESVDLQGLVKDTTLERVPMRRCAFEFKCDCSADKLLPFFRSLPEKELHELYGEDDVLVISCPRCGKRFEIPRSTFLQQL